MPSVYSRALGSVKPPPPGGRKPIDRVEARQRPTTFKMGFFFQSDSTLSLGKATKDTSPKSEHPSVLAADFFRIMGLTEEAGRGSPETAGQRARPIHANLLVRILSLPDVDADLLPQNDTVATSVHFGPSALFRVLMAVMCLVFLTLFFDRL